MCRHTTKCFVIAVNRFLVFYYDSATQDYEKPCGCKDSALQMPVVALQLLDYVCSVIYRNSVACV